MSNERIDLTQFEQLTVGKIGWWADFSREHGQHLILSGSGDDNDLEYIAEVYSETDKNLLVQFPKLIAELKRCYEEIDKLRKKPVSISCEHCSHIYEEEYLHEMLEMGPNGECVMCLEEASE